MRIKKLEIVGFKSFADKARLIFDDGITGVVGPNGCGKSNIVDAIRWCMGEMSAKHLRGRAMQDVIFAGSESRGAQGLAEVTLTFHNDGNVTPLYANFTELSVTRRLFSDGTSEYLINKSPARLRDITDLFLGTGVGTRAYSIIEQGRIGFIVNSRPEDRRSLIEEAAGITKFKARKKAAERRMEATEQNLLRVNDVVAELDKQLGSLRRQARKAMRFRDFKAKLRDLELHFAVLEYLRFSALEKMGREERDLIERQVEDTESGKAARETSLETDRLRLLEREREVQLLQEASHAIDAELAAVERDVTHYRQQVIDAKERGEQAVWELADAQEQITRCIQERESVSVERADLEAKATAGRRGIGDAKAAVNALQDELAVLDEELQVLRSHAMTHVQDVSRNRALASTLGKQRLDLATRLQAAQAELQGLETQHADASSRYEELQERRDAAGAELAEWVARLALLRERLNVRGIEVKKLDGDLTAQKAQLQTKRSRLHSLEEVASRLEGYSDGVRTLMNAKLPGILGLVSGVMTVPAHLEAAIEAALGERLQYMMVQTHADAQEAIEYLKTHSGGRGGFVPAETRDGNRTEVVGAGVVGAAIDLVQVDGPAATLLRDVVIVENIEAALALWPKAQATLVTLQGEVLNTSGVLVGGSAEGAGLLKSRREIRELQELVTVLVDDVQRSQDVLDEAVQDRTQLQSDVEQLDKDIRKAELLRVTLVKDTEAAATEMDRLAARVAQVQRESGAGAAQLENLEREEVAVMNAAKRAEGQHEDVDGRLIELQERRQVQANQLERSATQLTTQMVAAAAQEEKAIAAKASIERLNAMETDLQRRIERARAAIEHGRVGVVELEDRVQGGAEKARVLAQDAAGRRQTLSTARATYDGERQRLLDLEALIKDARKNQDSLQTRLMNLVMDLERIEMSRARLLEQVMERHDVALHSVVTDYHMRPMPGPEREEHRQELEKAIKDLGPINLTAIDECADVEKRHTFLVQQRDDLQSALDSLKRAIARINKASRERFAEAFEAVNTMFQKVYPRLFRGGVARLELTSSEDVLEAGVEIIASPPGKKLQSVSLLSGGEKALTATALVFAIFLIKPSPFCILDEVDAPLDEANVGRFNEMLREISKISQFIVITHNKQTMQQADRLYGITMEEPGLSKVVSVDLAKQDEVQAA